MHSCVKKFRLLWSHSNDLMVSQLVLAEKHIVFSRLIADLVNEAKTLLWIWISYCLPFFDTFALTKLSWSVFNWLFLVLSKKLFVPSLRIKRSIKSPIASFPISLIDKRLTAMSSFTETPDIKLNGFPSPGLFQMGWWSDY